MHPAVDPTREMHAEERVRGLGHGIYKRAHEFGTCGCKRPIFASECNHAHAVDGLVAADRARNFVGVQACARHDAARLDRFAGGFQQDARHRFACAVHALPEPYRRAFRLDLARRRTAYIAVVDDARVEHTERGHAFDMRLDLTQTSSLDEFTSYAVGDAAALECSQPVAVDLIDCDDDLAAHVVVDAMFLAVFDH